jgi:hypothetical protein
MTIDSTWDFDALSEETHSATDNLAGGEATNALMASVLGDSVGEPPQVPDPEDPHVELPGGLYWDGALLRTAEVRELNGDDEEALAALKGSLARWMSVMLERNVVRVGDVPMTAAMSRKLLIGDRDALLLHIRIVTFGPEITLSNIVCPHCDAALDATVDLRTVETVRLDTPAAGHEYTVPLRRGGTARVRLPGGEAQEAAFAEDASTAAQRNTRLLALCLLRVTDADGTARQKTGEALAQSLSMADRQLVLKYLAEHQPGPRLDDVTFTHSACGEEVRLPITLPELFRI